MKGTSESKSKGNGKFLLANNIAVVTTVALGLRQNQIGAT